MGYSSNTWVIILWNPDHTFSIYRAHDDWFEEYKYSLYIEDKKNPGYLPLQKYPESILYNSYLLNLITRELDITSTTFCDTKILTNEIDSPPVGNKIGFNLLDHEYFTIPYVIYTITNLPAGHKLPTQAKNNLCIVAINGEEPITSQGILDELQSHNTQRLKYKAKISIRRKKRYQKTDLEDIWSRLDQFRPVVSHFEVHIP